MLDAPYVVHKTKNQVDHNLCGVYQEVVQLCLKSPENYT